MGADPVTASCAGTVPEAANTPGELINVFVETADASLHEIVAPVTVPTKHLQETGNPRGNSELLHGGGACQSVADGRTCRQCWARC